MALSEEIEPSEPDAATLLLVAEDNAMNQKVIGHFLKALGYDAHFVDNGAEAVAKVELGGYDLILMDINMPIMDGVSATRTIRAMAGARAQVPIIAVTANVMDDQLVLYKKAGVNCTVPKPIELACLAEAISLHLGGATQLGLP